MKDDETIPLRPDEDAGPAAKPAAEVQSALATQQRTAKPGDLIYCVHAKGHPMESRVDRVREGGKVDLTVYEGAVGVPFPITSSPYDPTGKQPDSWRFPESEI